MAAGAVRNFIHQGDNDMRKYLHINLQDRTIETEELHGEAIIRVGRHFIAKTLLEKGAAKVDPLSPENPLIFSAGKTLLLKY